MTPSDAEIRARIRGLAQTPPGEPARAPLRTRLWVMLRAEWKFMTFNAALNTVLASTFVPRPLRVAGYRALGIECRTRDVYPGVRLYLRRADQLSIGRRVLINHDVLIEATAPVTIGDDVQIAHEVAIITSHHDRLPDGTISRQVSPRPVTIGPGAWLGARALICPGVTIAPRVTVAAGAVVVGDLTEAGATYGGVPARRLH